MSLAIDPGHVMEVLLSDGQWYEVADRSFELDAYEYVRSWWNEFEKTMVLHGGGNGGICSTGFSFRELGVDGEAQWVEGPLSAIVAIRSDRCVGLPKCKHH